MTKPNVLKSFPNDILELHCDEPRTIVLIPSVSIDGLTSQFLVGLNFFEERNLYYLACLANPQTRFVAILSDNVDDSIIEYCIDHACRAHDLTSTDIKQRFELIRVPTREDEHLTRSLLRQPELLGHIKQLLANHPDAVIDFWMVSELDIQLAQALELPYYGMPRQALHFDNKSNARRLFKSLGIRLPAGEEDILSPQDAWRQLRHLSDRSDADAFLIKLNSEEAGKGIAQVPRDAIDLPYEAFLEHISVAKNIPLDAFLKSISSQGAVVEEFATAPITACPSVKMEILPDGTVRNLATHDQILNGMAYAGAKFPANEDYRADIIQIGNKIAVAASQKGARGLVSVDFLATRPDDQEDWTLWGLEINARKGATTHPYYWSRWLTKAGYDETTGELSGRTGNIKYTASEFFTCPDLDRVAPATILRVVKTEGLDFDPARQSGVFVHMLTCVTRFGKIGATVIGHDDVEIAHYWQKLNALLESLACSSNTVVKE